MKQNKVQEIIREYLRDLSALRGNSVLDYADAAPCHPWCSFPVDPRTLTSVFFYGMVSA